MLRRVTQSLTDMSRSMAPYPRFTLTTSTELQTTFALSSSSSTLLDTAWGLDRPPGFMGPRSVERTPWTDLELKSKQIFPTAIRARGLSFAASGGAVGSVLVSQIWPIGIHRVGSKIYYFFMAVNLV